MDILNPKLRYCSLTIVSDWDTFMLLFYTSNDCMKLRKRVPAARKTPKKGSFQSLTEIHVKRRLLRLKKKGSLKKPPRATADDTLASCNENNCATKKSSSAQKSTEESKKGGYSLFVVGKVVDEILEEVIAGIPKPQAEPSQ